jgi:hypothetical protein
VDLGGGNAGEAPARSLLGLLGNSVLRCGSDLPSRASVRQTMRALGEFRCELLGMLTKICILAGYDGIVEYQ